MSLGNETLQPVSERRVSDGDGYCPGGPGNGGSTGCPWSGSRRGSGAGSALWGQPGHFLDLPLCMSGHSSEGALSDRWLERNTSPVPVWL